MPPKLALPEPGRIAPAATDTKAQDHELKTPKSPRRWWQFWRWFEKDETAKDPDVL
ncbi:MAG: hypothetical protein FD126_360 [Elusimicrobia bacterium]|nr:MAG: hypothetical protein FD126_360 [Elusimicrobiota bacterium]